MEKNNTLKMIQVDAKTHAQAKKQALKRQLTLKVYIQKLLDQDK